MTKVRPTRDPNAPKRNKSAYLIFQNEQRDYFKSVNPGLSFGELSKMTSAVYQTLSHEQKEELQRKAELDKQRYLNEMLVYTPSPGYDHMGNIITTYPHATTKKGSKARDPVAPKRNLSAYLLYQNAMRDRFRAQNPGMTFGQLSQHTSYMYKCLSPEEKAQWDERARRDKERYDEEMASYTPPLGFTDQGYLMADFTLPRKNSRKNPKDPHMPKRARGSYVLFTFDERPKIFAEHPGIKFTDLGAILGQRWRDLSPEIRKKYDDLAEQDKLRFMSEMEVYKAHAKEMEQHMSSNANVHMNHHVMNQQNMGNYANYDAQDSDDHVVDYVLQNHRNHVMMPSVQHHPINHNQHNEYIQHAQMHYHPHGYVNRQIDHGHQIYDHNDIYQHGQNYHAHHGNNYFES